MLRDPTISFLLPSYAKAQALALESLVSPPSQIVSYGYRLGIRAFIDDETLELITFLEDNLIYHCFQNDFNFFMILGNA
jgi:hypothetical protein